MKINKIVSVSFALLLFAGFMSSCVSSKSSGDNSESQAKKTGVLTAQERAALAFYVYADYKSPLNHFYPSGWMGDSKDLKFDQNSTEYPYAGKSCIKVVYTPDGRNGWAGIFWQQPANNWGDSNGGFDLSKATHITFWMRGENGGEIVSEVKIGGFKGLYPDTASAVKKDIKLTKNWKLYYIDLRGKKLTRIAGGFSFAVSKDDNPKGCTFYIDEVRYEMEK
ncbi:MAG: hypothetical protein FWF00_05780 [Endomicrobia bacterium]|nr:hypothetical protein [Endomicrobiia bacterium]MCL2507178.1 hypothetical protein [Endomicrobiia bacterium]